jgi:hypothetical protein
MERKEAVRSKKKSEAAAAGLAFRFSGSAGSGDESGEDQRLDPRLISL